ncbi:hypothetical protein [Micromonospora avicenniae]
MRGPSPDGGRAPFRPALLNPEPQPGDLANRAMTTGAAFRIKLAGRSQ